MELFAGQWWTASRTKEQVDGVLEGSQVLFSAVHVPTDRLVGFTRILTDRTIVAVVLDVMVPRTGGAPASAPGSWTRSSRTGR